MQSYYKAPFIFLTIFLVFGSLLSSYLEIWVGYLLFCIGVTGIILFKTRLTVVCSLIVACACGVLSHHFFGNRLKVTPEKVESSIFRVEVLEKKEFSNSEQLLVQIQNHEFKELESKEILISSKSFKSIFAGDELLINSRLTPIKGPNIPDQFSFKEYYKNKGIYWQVYLREAYQIKKIGEHKNWNYYLQKTRGYLANNLQNTFGESPEEAVLRALIIGDKSHLSYQVRQSYTTAGIIHILAVSGLHVGFFYLLLMFFIKRIPYRWFQGLCLILGLCFYAGLTGFSPSVVRASFMFFFFGCAQIINRNTNSIHVLFISTFFILLVKPNFISEPGFQLSFAAVLGILLAYEPLNNFMKSKNWLVKQIWSGLSVSLVAQVFTAPLIVYYFHQLPVYFLLTNLIAVVVVQFALISGAIIALFGDVPIISSVAINSVKVIQTIAEWSSQLPIPKISGLYVSQIQVYLLYVLIIGCMLFYMKKRRIYAFSGLLSGILMVSISFQRMIEYKDQNVLAFHKVKNQLVIENTKGKKSNLIILNSELNKEKIERTLSNYFSRVNSVSFQLNELKEPLIIKGKSIGFISESHEPYFDYNVCLNKKKFKIIDRGGEELFSSFSTQSLVIRQ